MNICKVAGCLVVKAADGDDGGLQWRQLLITNHTSWFARPLLAMPPCMARERCKVAPVSPAWQKGIVLSIDGDRAEPIVKAAARIAFPGMTVPMLQRLVSLEEVTYAGARPERERELLALLIRHFFPKMPEAKVQEIIDTRARKAHRHEHILSEANAEVVEGLVEDNFCSTVKTAMQQARATKAEKEPAANVGGATSPSSTSASSGGIVPSEGAAAVSASASSTSASSGGIVPSVAASLLPIPRRDHTVQQARLHIPPGSWIGIHKNQAWQVKYHAKPTWPRSHTVTWQQSEGGVGVDKHVSLLQCLRWVWEAHTQRTGEQCPWDLGHCRGL